MTLLPVIDAIDRYASDNPANTAICGKARIVTYESLRDAIVNVSARFRSAGIACGSKVFINCADEDIWTAVALGCLHYGLVPFFVSHPGNTSGEVDHDVIVSSPEPVDEALGGDIEVDDTIFAPAGETLETYACTDRKPDDLLAVAVTSGTTGLPKLLAWTNAVYARRFDVRKTIETGFRVVDTFSGRSSTGLTMMSAYFGCGCNVVRGDNDPVTLLRLINLFRVDKLKTSAKTIASLMQTMDRTGMKCPSIRIINFVGSQIPTELLKNVERHFSAEIYNAYGISEVGSLSRGVIASDRYRPGMTGPVWTPLDLYTRPHEESGRDQFVVRNDPGYILADYRDGKAVTVEGDEYPLPDFGVIEDGIVYVEGRVDEVYNLSGTKFAYSTLNNFLTGLNGIDDAAVVRDPRSADPFSLNVAIAHTGYVDHEAVLERLCQRLNKRTARDHIRLKSVGEIPRNAAGKIDRGALLALFGPGSGDGSAS